MKCIIISGKAGSGKDMTAHFMREKLEEKGKRVITIHYGDAVKWVIKDYFNWSGNKDEEGRKLLQTIGTDVVRAKHPDFWVKVVADLLSAFEAADLFDIALIPDARFENEINVVIDSLPDSITVRIERANEDGTPWVNTTLTEEQRKHPSETSLDKYSFDYIIHNDEGLETLKESAISVLADAEII